MPNYYEILGVSKDADLREIKRAYHMLARLYHPDRQPDDETADQRFQEATEAYHCLSDAKCRRAYDHGFDPVDSVEDLLFREESGRKWTDILLPGAPISPKRGKDVWMVCPVSTDRLDQGGTVEISLPFGRGKTFVSVPVHARNIPWCRIIGLGEPGKKGAPNGDFWIFFQQQEEKKA